MSSAQLEVADVIKQFGHEFVAKYGRSLSVRQRRAIRDIEICRTAALGGHKEECDGCGRESYSCHTPCEGKCDDKSCRAKRDDLD